MLLVIETQKCRGLLGRCIARRTILAVLHQPLLSQQEGSVGYLALVQAPPLLGSAALQLAAAQDAWVLCSIVDSPGQAQASV